MLLAARAGKTVMIKVEHLHYGKLVSGDGGGAVSSEGLGVTLRSRGFPRGAENLRLNSLLDVKMFDPDMIDPAMADVGLLLVRTFPNVFGPLTGYTILVRARFRPEKGEGSTGRVHQQAAIWIVRQADWEEHAASILAKAGTALRANPDRVDTASSKRFDVEPLTIELLKSENGAQVRRTEPVCRILHMLLTSEPSADGKVDFGKESFGSEAEFLEVVGTALGTLAHLPFRGWSNICIGSGLNHTRSGKLVRYLPSERLPLPPPIEEASIARRLDELSARPRAVGRDAISLGDRRPSPRPVPPPSAPPFRSDSPNDHLCDFPGLLGEYRKNLSQEAASRLIDFILALRGNYSVNEVKLAETLAADERSAFEGLGLALSQPSSEIVRSSSCWDLARSFDCHLFLSKCNNRPYAQIARKFWLRELEQAVVRARILLPMEFERLRSARFAEIFERNEYVGPVLARSGRLADCLKMFKSGRHAAVEEESKQFMAQRFKGILAGASPAVLDRGIHDELVMGSEGLMSAPQYQACLTGMFWAYSTRSLSG